MSHQRYLQHSGVSIEPAQEKQQRAVRCRHKTPPAQQGTKVAGPTKQPFSSQRLLGTIRPVPHQPSVLHKQNMPCCPVTALQQPCMLPHRQHRQDFMQLGIAWLHTHPSCAEGKAMIFHAVHIMMAWVWLLQMHTSVLCIAHSAA